MIDNVWWIWVLMMMMMMVKGTNRGQIWKEDHQATTSLHKLPLTITPSLNVLSVHSSSFTTWPPFSRLRCWVDVNEDVWWRRVKGELANPRLPVRMVIEPTCACVCVIVMCVRGSTLLSRRAWTLITWLHWCLKLCRSTRASSSAQQRRTVRMLHSSSPDLCRRELVLAACNSFQRFWPSWVEFSLLVTVFSVSGFRVQNIVASMLFHVCFV